MPSTAHRMPDGTQDPKNDADRDEHDTDGPQDRYAGHQTDDQ